MQVERTEGEVELEACPAMREHEVGPEPVELPVASDDS